MPENDAITNPYDWDIPIPVLPPMPILEIYDPLSGEWRSMDFYPFLPSAEAARYPELDCLVI